ncbi:treacle protein isoform X3 [Xyrauchen texanus]|uniref:treacle protein isoform X3 n=1 Tax=Xyrauchen texanus TaxID=154827 RepID=UPI002242AF80|nr:treacle protein isoform X3 [Xyrauchen texanus]
MTSKLTDAPQDELINLIYRHLKDNGYRKAANVLRKHAPQVHVETKEVQASLGEIFKKWARNEDLDDEDVPSLPSGIQTPELKSPAKIKTDPLAVRKSHKKHNTAGNMASSKVLSPQKPDDTNRKKTSRGSPSKSQKQKKKEMAMIPRKGKTFTSEDGASKSQTVSSAAVNDSDSDSETSLDVEKWRTRVTQLSVKDSDSDSETSLDVEKWRTLVTQLSDADIVKMNVLSNFDKSTISSSGKSKEKRKTTKATKSKKEGDPPKNIKSNTPTRKSRAKNAIIPLKTVTTKTLSKKSKDKTATAVSELPKVKTPSKKARDKKISNISGHDVVETTEIAAPGDANGSSETPSKKAKKKKSEIQSDADNVENPNCSSNTYKVVTNASKLAQANCEDANHMIDDAQLKSKKVKDKGSKSVVEPVDGETHSKKVKAKKTKSLAKLEAATSEKVDVLENSETPTKKAKTKKSEIQSDGNVVETPKKSDDSLSNTKEIVTSASMLAQANPSEDANPTFDVAHLKTDQSKTPTNKVTDKKSKTVVEPVDCETPSKKVKSKKTENIAEISKETTSEDIGVLQVSVNPETPSKKAKKKKLDIQSESDQVETPKRNKDSPSNAKEVIKEVKKVKNVSKPAQDNCEDDNIAIDDGHLKSDQSEEPSKKVTDKKSKTVVEPVDCETPSKKVKSKKTENIAEISKETTSEEVGGASSIR